MSSEERAVYIRQQAQQRLQERMRALRLSGPPTSSPMDTSVGGRLEKERKEAEEKALQAEKDAEERERVIKERLNVLRVPPSAAPSPPNITQAKSAPRPPLPPAPPLPPPPRIKWDAPPAPPPPGPPRMKYYAPPAPFPPQTKWNAPPPPPAPPAPKVPALAFKKSDEPDRGAVFSAITAGAPKLRNTVTNDRSGVAIAGSVIGGDVKPSPHVPNTPSPYPPVTANEYNLPHDFQEVRK